MERRRGRGEVNVAVYPWDVSLGSTTPDDSRMNHVSAAVVSVAPMGNRTRVRVGPIVAEITAASAERLDLRPGVARDRVLQGDGRPALSRASGRRAHSTSTALRPSQAASDSISAVTAFVTGRVNRTSSCTACTRNTDALRSAVASSFPTSSSWWRIGRAK